MANEEKSVNKQTKAIVTLIEDCSEEIDLENSKDYFTPHRKQISAAIKEHFSKIKETK